MKTVLITGCSTGIGHAACEFFAERGWAVFAGSRRPETLNFRHTAIKPVALDVNDTASIDRCFASLPPLECVVNNAGYGLLLPFEDTPPEEIEKMFRTNVLGLMEVSRRAARMMRERGHGLPTEAPSTRLGTGSAKTGTIINISSVLGVIGTPWYAAYSATKWAVEGFSESLAHELKPFNVHVKIVEPGGTKTEFHDRAYADFPVSDAYKERFGRKRASRTSKGDYETPESVAEIIFDAATDESWRLRYGARQARKMLWWQRVIGRDGLWKRLAAR